MRRVLVRYYGWTFEGYDKNKKKYFVRSHERDIGRVYIYVGGYMGINNGIRYGSGYGHLLKFKEKGEGWLYVVLLESGEKGKYMIANIIESDEYKLTALLGK